MSNPRFDFAKRESFLLKKIPQNFRAAQKYAFIFIKILINSNLTKVYRPQYAMMINLQFPAQKIMLKYISFHP